MDPFAPLGPSTSPSLPEVPPMSLGSSESTLGSTLDSSLYSSLEPPSALVPDHRPTIALLHPPLYDNWTYNWANYTQTLSIALWIHFTGTTNRMLQIYYPKCEEIRQRLKTHTPLFEVADLFPKVTAALSQINNWKRYGRKGFNICMRLRLCKGILDQMYASFGGEEKTMGRLRKFYKLIRIPDEERGGHAEDCAKGREKSRHLLVLEKVDVPAQDNGRASSEESEERGRKRKRMPRSGSATSDPSQIHPDHKAQMTQRKAGSEQQDAEWEQQRVERQQAKVKRKQAKAQREQRKIAQMERHKAGTGLSTTGAGTDPISITDRVSRPTDRELAYPRAHRDVRVYDPDAEELSFEELTFPDFDGAFVTEIHLPPEEVHEVPVAHTYRDGIYTHPVPEEVTEAPSAHPSVLEDPREGKECVPLASLGNDDDSLVRKYHDHDPEDPHFKDPRFMMSGALSLPDIRVTCPSPYEITPENLKKLEEVAELYSIDDGMTENHPSFFEMLPIDHRESLVALFDYRISRRGPKEKSQTTEEEPHEMELGFLDDLAENDGEFPPVFSSSSSEGEEAPKRAKSPAREKLTEKAKSPESVDLVETLLTALDREAAPDMEVTPGKEVAPNQEVASNEKKRGSDKEVAPEKEVASDKNITSDKKRKSSGSIQSPKQTKSPKRKPDSKERIDVGKPGSTRKPAQKIGGRRRVGGRKRKNQHTVDQLSRSWDGW